jgi:hypothetical protein
MPTANSLDVSCCAFGIMRCASEKETEPWELLYFKVFKSQLPVIEQALDTASRMLGTDTSRG